MEVRGGVHVAALSDGESILLLPRQFSRCLSITPSRQAAGAVSPRLLRANLVQTPIAFDRVLDADVRFDFGFGRRAGCRLDEVADYEALDFRWWTR